MMKAAVLALPALALLVAACAYQYQTGYPAGLPQGTQTCPNDRPEICSQDYRPVFGYDKAGGIVGEFANACMACAGETVNYTSAKRTTSPAGTP